MAALTALEPCPPMVISVARWLLVGLVVTMLGASCAFADDMPTVINTGQSASGITFQVVIGNYDLESVILPLTKGNYSTVTSTLPGAGWTFYNDVVSPPGQPPMSYLEWFSNGISYENQTLSFAATGGAGSNVFAGANVDFNGVSFDTTPESTSAVLLGTGLLAIALVMRKRMADGARHG
jgi:hypothetical protein